MATAGVRVPQAHGNGRWGGQNVCFPESSWVGALARQGLTAKAGHWLIAWAGGKAGVGAAGWCPGQSSGGIFPGSSWRRMKTPIEVTHLTARRWESIPDPVPGFPARDTDSDGRAGPLIVFTERLGGGFLLGGLVPGDRGAGVTVALGLEDGFSAQNWRQKGRRVGAGGGGRAGVSSERSGGFGAHPRSLSQCLSGRCSPAGLRGPVTSGVSQLHLGAELGPAVGPVDGVVADAEEPLGEAQGGHQQGDAQEEQHPLAHAGLLLL